MRLRGQELEDGLRAGLAPPNVGDIRGRGLFWTAEVVADRETKMPFDVKHNVAGRLQGTAMAAGMLCYPSQGCADGVAGDHVLLAPPFTSTEAEIDLIVETMAQTIEKMTAGL